MQRVHLRELVAMPSRKLKVPRQEFRRSHRVGARVSCLCQRIQNKARRATDRAHAKLQMFMQLLVASR